MKNLILSLAIASILCATVGCAGGGLCNWWRNKHNNNGCQPALEPSYGFGYQQPCATGNCGGVTQGTNYMNDSFIQSDPYMSGSNFGGATINPPVFDNYSNPSLGSTIVPPASSGIMPGPSNGN